MQSSDVPRRNLAAVLFADIVGYTQLTFDDEDSAYQVAMTFQSVTKSSVARHGGNLVKFTGDGALAVFPSADSAVRAGLVLGRDFKSKYQGSSREHLVRVGIHLGDVVYGPDGDVYGDGVNTACRLQQIAEPGQVVASEDVWRQLRHRADFEIQALGERTLKGVPDPIDLFLIRSGPQDNGILNEAANSVETSSRTPIILAAVLVLLSAGGVLYAWKTKPETDPRDFETQSEISTVSQVGDSSDFRFISIAVLPLTPLSSEEDQGYFADGMTEELTSALAQVEGLRVVSRTSAYEYREGADVRTIGADLGVGTILEGSVRSDGDSVRITIQLINAHSGYHLWSKSYDRDARNSLAIQEEVALQAVKDLGIVFSPLRSNPRLLTMD